MHHDGITPPPPPSLSDLTERFPSLEPADPGNTVTTRDLQVIAALRAVEMPMPRAEFVSGLRAQLMAMDLEETAPVIDLAARRHRRRISTAVAAAAMMVGATGVAAAAQSALPGDMLRPVKDGLQSMQLSMLSGASKGQAQLGDADVNLSDLGKVLASHPVDQSSVNTLAGEFTKNANGGSNLLFADFTSSGKPSDIAAIRDFTAQASATLKTLAAKNPSEISTLGPMSTLVSDIDSHALALCSSACSGRPAVQPLAMPASQTSTPALQTLLTAPPAPAVSPATPVTHVATATPRTTTPSTAPTLPVPLPTTAPAPVTTLGTTLGGVVKGLTGGNSTTTNSTSPAPNPVGTLTGTVTGLVGSLTGGLL